MSIKEMLAKEAEDAESLPVAEGTYVRNRRVAKDPSQVYSLRIPVDRLAELRQVADRQGVAPSALMRRWVLERLDREAEAASRVQELREDLASEDVIVIERDQFSQGLVSIIQAVLESEHRRA
ncbi:hypothetical protein [Cellulosimicrobium sp. SH8]|uniref:hypothetical protein n=1 Tax=Cellulosimicrobium sp. SH8 TaxID=2952936 RepID=UPI0021F2B317|nr:hypothetical protein [Cellulosimicrobium sp. SH8]